MCGVEQEGNVDVEVVDDDLFGQAPEGHVYVRMTNGTGVKGRSLVKVNWRAGEHDVSTALFHSSDLVSTRTFVIFANQMSPPKCLTKYFNRKNQTLVVRLLRLLGDRQAVSENHPNFQRNLSASSRPYSRRREPQITPQRLSRFTQIFLFRPQTLSSHPLLAETSSTATTITTTSRSIGSKAPTTSTTPGWVVRTSTRARAGKRREVATSWGLKVGGRCRGSSRLRANGTARGVARRSRLLA